MIETDKKLLCALRQSGMLSKHALYKKTGIIAPTIYAKLKKFKDQGFIRKSTVLVNFKKLGFPLQLLFFIEFNNAENAKYFSGKEQVNTLFELEDKNTFVLECIFTSGADVDYFITDLEEKMQPKKILFWPVKNELAREAFFC